MLYCQTLINSLLLALRKSFPTNHLWTTQKLWYSNSSQKSGVKPLSTTVPQLSFPLFPCTLALWCVSFFACATDDLRHASKKKPKPPNKHYQKPKEPTKPQNTWNPFMSNKARRNYCRDFIKHFLFYEKLYVTLTIRKLAFWSAFGTGSSGSYWDMLTF